MKWHAYYNSRYFEIHHDPLVGFYLYVFERKKCVRDYLQDTLELAMNHAWEEYGVRKEIWEIRP